MSKKISIEYEIQYTKKAEKFFKKHEKVREQYELSIQRLITDDHPEEIDVKKISGKMNEYFRIRLGNYRVIYAVINKRIVVINTLLAGARGDVYKKMTNLN
ncbi:type II toxin-antitoxin system mRNA interferase toxin, RelE/StbE family [uncultured Succiniclasticum sp.]|uniref:type II toxin-antitoxin system RelE family toxin n=1 Tax=uncultured Succiniclasticum sp. TaxID=1500547 RepID=UPI0025E6D300|nr:type II toxin-antitoxin system mRNA interferase toxin, RelE/StbE family [uncultured Succiniclasticum sp.]